MLKRWEPNSVPLLDRYFPVRAPTYPTKMFTLFDPVTMFHLGLLAGIGISAVYGLVMIWLDTRSIRG